MLAEQRGRPPDRPRRVGELHQDAERADRALDGVLDGHLHLARPRVHVGEHLGVVVDQPARHAALDQRGDPRVGAARGQHADSSSATSSARFAIRSSLVANRGDSREVLAPDPWRSHSNSACMLPPTVMCPSAVPKGLVGRGQAGARSQLARHAAGRPQLRGLPHRQRQSALEQRRVDVLSAPGALARVQLERIAHAEQPGGEVADRDAALDRLAAELAGDAHHARQPLRDQVVAGALRVRPSLAEAEIEA